MVPAELSVKVTINGLSPWLDCRQICDRDKSALCHDGIAAATIVSAANDHYVTEISQDCPAQNAPQIG